MKIGDFNIVLSGIARFNVVMACIVTTLLALIGLGLLLGWF